MKEDIAILEATKEDLKGVLAVQKAAFMQEADRIGDHDIAPLHQDLESLAEDLAAYKIFKAVCGGTIAGTVKARMDGNQCWLERLAVDPGYQKKGIGRKLIAAAEEYFAEAAVFILFTETGNTKALNLYGSAGYFRNGETVRDPRSGIELVKLSKYNDRAL